MNFGFHLLSWRQDRALSQATLASKAGILRPYLSKLERGSADPSLSIIRQLAVAMDLTPGQLIDTMPKQRTLSKDQMDRTARTLLEKDRKTGVGDHALRRLRVRLGEDQWKAVLRRVEKHQFLADS